MNTQKNFNRKFRPTMLGLLFLLFTIVGCGDSATTVGSSDQSGDAQVLAREDEADELQVVDDFEALNEQVLARAADVYPANVRMGSTTNDGVSANGHSYGASLSEDGRYLSFVSKANNLLDQPTNNQYQVYRKDLETGELVCVSREGNWAPPADGRSHHARISDDGKRIAFSSRSTNLLYGVSADSGKDNAYLAEFFPEYPGGPTGEFQVKLLTPTESTRSGYGQKVASNGTNIVKEFAGNRFVGFRSNATDLHWDDQDTRWDLYRFDAEPENYWANDFELLSRGSNYQKANSSSLNLGLLADSEAGFFTTFATNLTPGGVVRPSLQKMESYYVGHYPLEDKKSYDVDVAENDLSRFAVSVRNQANNGYESYFYRPQYPGDPVSLPVKLASVCVRDDSFDVSDDGRFVVYQDKANRPELGDTDGRYDIFLFDSETNTHTLVTDNTPSNGHAYRPVISDDGTTIAWDQGGRVYLVGNPELGAAPPTQAQLVSSTQDGLAANSGWSGVKNPSLSSNGKFLTFESKATNLVSDAISGKRHIYRKNLATGELVLVSRKFGDDTPVEGYGQSFVSDDGKTVVFSSSREDIGDVNVQTNNYGSTYLRDMDTSETKFLFTKGRLLDLMVHPHIPDSFRLFFTSYGSVNEAPNGVPRGLYEGELPYFYPYQYSLIPTWMTEQYLLQDMKVSDDGRYALAAFTDSSTSPSRTLLYRFESSYYYGQSSYDLITDNLYYQDFDMSADGQVIAYTERLGGDYAQKMMNYRNYNSNNYYGGYDSHFVTHTQATTPHLSADGRYLLYYDTNYEMGASSGSGSNAYVYDSQSREALPVREERISYPGSLRLSDDGRSVIFEDYDYETGTQLYFIKNPHPTTDGDGNPNPYY